MSTLFDGLFIFEVANNHQGSLDHGLKIVEAMAEIARRHQIKAGVKFQYRNLDTFIHPDYQERQDVKHVPRFMSTRLTDTDFLTMLDAARAQGLMTVVTPFDEASVDTCLDHGVDILKIASCSALDWPLLEAVAATGKPTIISTGGLSIYDIDNIVSFFTHRSDVFALMHCVSLYPTPNDRGQMAFLDRLRRRYRHVPIGYSGHEAPDNFDVVKVAVSKQALLLERHVGVPTETISLNKYSMAPSQVDAWVASALTARTICGVGPDKEVTDAEKDALLSLKRGVFAATAVKKGAVITRDQVFFAMPCAPGQTTSGEFGQYRARLVASRDYAALEPISEHAQPDIIRRIRGIIHDAKGMIYEAGIALGDDFEIELSHHFGLENFREIGALIVNLINREYCKKLVILLPGQRHPNHKHQIKEETFQLLWGELEIRIDGETRQLKPGDKALVPRHTWHSFRSERGAIFEEISTTHLRGDSYYEDPAIDALDPMQRKTVLEEW